MRHGASWLPWIIAFKAFKSISLAVLGVVLLATRQLDPVDVLTRVAMAIHLPLTSELFDRALRAALNLSVARQTALGITAFAYSALMGTEGVALYLRKPWARWFTIGATASLLPIEVYELAKEVHPVRVIVFLVNIAIVVYLWRRADIFEVQEKR
jgi:uncharacterized membrane protein (DUF2068 family)